jgi:GNAT superfamily N-acetyltransferase
MGLSWEIREATPEDAVGLKSCMESAYSLYQKRMGGERLPPMDVDYLDEIEKYPCWVIDAEGIILGGLIMVFDNQKASLANISIDPKFQGLGIGGELIRFAKARAKDKKYSELHLATHILLEENISIYQHLGWEITGKEGKKVLMKIKL